MTYKGAVRQFKKKLILDALDAEKDNFFRAAARLGIHRNTLSRTMGELGLNATNVRKIIKAAA